MKTIKATIPQIVFETVTFELSDEQADNIQHMGDSERADLVMKYMTETQCDWLPNGKKSLLDAFEYGFCRITGYK